MIQYVKSLSKSPLFARISEKELITMLTCLRAQIISAEKGKTILHQGDPAKQFGVLVSGSANIIHVGETGNHIIIANVKPGETFAETFACSEFDALPVSVVANETCTVLMLEHRRVVTGCQNGCTMHSRLVTNLLKILAQKNLILNQKLQIVMQHTTREKLLLYLMTEHQKSESDRFAIPFDRQGLADYLGVERSAMSSELSKLQKSGILRYCKNEFEFLYETAQNETEKTEE